MSRRSLDSERPIMAPSLASKRASQRFSTYSASPSFATTSSTDTVMAEIKELTDSLDRLENKPLQQQRFVPSAEKTDTLSKLALGTKIDKALGRRMSSQDAVMKVKPTNTLSEKPPMEEAASA